MIMDILEISILTVVLTELSIQHHVILFVRKAHEQVVMGE